MSRKIVLCSFFFLYSRHNFFSSAEDHDLFLYDITYISSFSFLSFFLFLSTFNKCVELSFVITSLSPSLPYCQHHLYTSRINFFSFSTSINLHQPCIVLEVVCFLFLFREKRIKSKRTSNMYVFDCITNMQSNFVDI